jgi:maleylpyruvate isomerase
MRTLYNYFRSSASFRVRIVLHLKGLAYHDIPVHLVNNGGEQHLPDYQIVNPQCFVPTLVDDEKVFTQSLAIIEYLNELHPTPPLLPANAYEKAQVRSFAYIIAADIHPLNNLSVLQYLTHQLHIQENDKITWYQHWIQKGFSALEKTLQRRNSITTFCFGDMPTLADICLVPQMYNARRYNCDLSAYPLLTRIDAHCQEHPAFQKAWPAE